MKPGVIEEEVLYIPKDLKEPILTREKLHIKVYNHGCFGIRQKKLKARVGDNQEQLISRTFSRHDTDLLQVLVFQVDSRDCGIPEHDPRRSGRWNTILTTTPQFEDLQLTEEEAFQLAIRNLDEDTPQQIPLELKGSPFAGPPCTAFFKMKQANLILADFTDRRNNNAAPRLLLPRVVAKLSDLLECRPEDVVVLPNRFTYFWAAACYDRRALALMAEDMMKPLQVLQSDFYKQKEFLSSLPLQVSKQALLDYISFKLSVATRLTRSYANSSPKFPRRELFHRLLSESALNCL